MKCAWDSFLNILPSWMRSDVDRLGKNDLQELRVRIGQAPELVMFPQSVFLAKKATEEDLTFIVNTASRYSPWAASTVEHGYITAAGGHRIGICGEAVVQQGTMSGVRTPTSLCIRIARDFPGIASKIRCNSGSVLIIGQPGSGKTTLLRDMIRQRAQAGTGSVAVIDERGEIFPVSHGKYFFPPGLRTDILTGCKKSQGIETVLRTMGPSCIAVDEITAQTDCHALLHAGWCGVSLLATAHAHCKADLFTRPVYRPLVECKLFDTLLVLRPDKSWLEERMDL